MSRCLALVAACVCFILTAHGDVKPILDGPDGLKAFNDLATYYSDRTKEPPYDEALASLSKGGDSAQHAGEYLLGLFEQSMADETNGRSESTRSMAWGGGSENAARDFRKTLAEKFGDSATSSAAIPAALWLINEEKLPDGQTAGIKVLRRINSPAATDAYEKILAQPHPNQDVLVGAIEETGLRKLTALQVDIVPLENSYRSVVRDAARKTAQQLGAAPAPAFNSESSFSPALCALIQKIADRVFSPVPSGAQWVDIVYTNPNARQGAKPAKSHGWLLRTEGDNYVILDWQGLEEPLAKTDTRLTPSTLAVTAKELEAIRKDSSKYGIHALSTEGGLTAQFEPGFITMPEALVGAWSFVRGDKATAAGVLFPCFDAAKDDRWIDWATRDLLGNQYHQRMLEDFSLKRDYAAALKLAQHLSKAIFDDFNYQDRAKELAKQLSQRMDDFKTFTLPTPDQWTQQKAGMKREDQISFLASHLRLLNCMQIMQPGGVSYADPQYAQPFSLLHDPVPNFNTRTWSYPQGTEVINPYNELKAMSLLPTDIQLLLPYVSDDDFMPTYSYWRSFHPGRTLHRVSWAITDLINQAAQQTLVDLSSLEGLDDAGKQAALDKIKVWCTAHQSKSASDLLAETIKTTQNQHDFLRASRKALQENQPQLVVLAASRSSHFPKVTSDIAEICLKSGAHGFADQARQWIKANSPPKPPVLGQATVDEWSNAQDVDEIRFWSALILIREGGDAETEGLSILQPILDKDDGGFFYPRAVATLLATKDEKLITLAYNVLKKPSLLTQSWDTADQLKRLFLTGRPECRDFLIAELKDTAPGQGESSRVVDGKIVKAHPANSQNIVNIICQWRGENSKIDEFSPNGAQIKQRKTLEDWINAQFDLIRQGKQPNMKTQLSSDIPEAQIDAP